MRLLNNPAVYAQIHAWLARRPSELATPFRLERLSPLFAPFAFAAARGTIEEDSGDRKESR
jgi:hypothetical protein